MESKTTEQHQKWDWSNCLQMSCFYAEKDKKKKKVLLHIIFTLCLTLPFKH